MDYLHENDTYSAVKCALVEGKKIHLKSLKHKPDELDKVAPFIKNKTKLMEYYALNGRYEQVVKLINNGVLKSYKVAANGIRSGDHIDEYAEMHRNMGDYPHDSDYSLDSLIELIEFRSPNTKIPEYVALRTGNLRAAEKLFSYNRRYVLHSAILSRDEETINWALKRIRPDKYCLAMAHYMQNEELIEKFKEFYYNTELSLYYGKPCHFVDTESCAAVASWTGNLKYLSQIKNSLNSFYTYPFAVVNNQIGVLKYVKSRGITMISGFSYFVIKGRNFEMCNNVDTIRDLIYVAICKSSLKTIKWVLNHIYHNGDYYSFPRPINDNDKKFNIRFLPVNLEEQYYLVKNLKFDVMKWFYKKDIFSKDGYFSLLVETANAHKIKEFYDDSINKNMILEINNIIEKNDLDLLKWLYGKKFRSYSWMVDLPERIDEWMKENDI